MRRGKQAAGVLLYGIGGGVRSGNTGKCGRGKDKRCKTEAVQTKEPVQSLSSVNGQATIPQIRLSVGDGQSTPQYAAEEQVELVVKVTNQGVADAQNVRITPMIDNAADLPFVIESMNYEQNLGTIKAGERVEAKWAPTVRSDVETKSYKSLFAISYDDGKTPYDAEDDRCQYDGETGGAAGRRRRWLRCRIPIQIRIQIRRRREKHRAAMQVPIREIFPVWGGAMIPGDGGVYNSDPVVSGGGSTSKSVPRGDRDRICDGSGGSQCGQ